MCSASDYKSPRRPWQFYSVALGGPFHTCESNSVEPLISRHLLAYLLSSSSRLYSLETTLMRPVAFICVNFPLAAPQLSESFYFPKGNHQMLSL